MAYRTFENEKIYEAPDVKFLPKTYDMLRIAMQQKGQQMRHNRALAANYREDKLASKFTTDQEELNYLTQANTQSAVSDFSNLGNLSAKTQEGLSRAQGYKATSDAQWAMKEDLEKAVNDRVIRGPKAEKNYFNKDVAQQKIIQAAYGDPNERVTWNERGGRLQHVQSNIGKDYINEFNKDAFVSDYIDELKTQTLERDSKSQTGVKSGRKVTGVFFDENGVPKVTDNHAVEFLNSSPDVQERYKQEVDLELIDDARKMAATKDGAWVADLLKENPRQVVELFRNDPSMNTTSKMTPGQRERELARRDLEAKHKVSIANSYDASGAEAGHDRGLTSKDYTIENSYNPNDFGGAGGVFVDKKKGTKGIPIKIGKAFDKTSLKETGNTRSPRTLFADSFNLSLVDNGTPIAIKGTSIDEQIAQINALPDKAFRNLDLKTVIHGKSYNTTDLDKSRKRYQELKLTPELTMSDEERAELGKLELAFQSLEADPDMAPEVVQKVLGVAVEDLVKVVEPGTNEAKEIKGKLGSFDITDQKKWDDDQKRLYDAFHKRKKQAVPALAAEDRLLTAQAQKMQDNPPEGGKPSKGKAVTAEPVAVSSQEDYDKLPAGSKYIDPDGNVRTKKK